MTVDKLVDMLRRRQLEFSRVHLGNPGDKKEAFDYGVACGTFSAYEQMLEDIKSAIEQEKQDSAERERHK